MQCLQTLPTHCLVCVGISALLWVLHSKGIFQAFAACVVLIIPVTIWLQLVQSVFLEFPWIARHWIDPHPVTDCTAGAGMTSLFQQHLLWAPSSLNSTASGQAQRNQGLKYLRKNMGYEFGTVKTTTHRIQNTVIFTGPRFWKLGYRVSYS